MIPLVLRLYPLTARCFTTYTRAYSDTYSILSLHCSIQNSTYSILLLTLLLMKLLLLLLLVLFLLLILFQMLHDQLLLLLLLKMLLLLFLLLLLLFLVLQLVWSCYFLFAKDKLYTPPSEGGVGLININDFLIAQHAMWFKRAYVSSRDDWRYDLCGLGYGNPFTVSNDDFSKSSFLILHGLVNSFSTLFSQFVVV